MTTPPDLDDVAARCHLNTIAYAKEGAQRSSGSGDVVEDDGVLLYASGSDFPVIANGAFRLDPAVAADDVLDRAEAWFAARRRGWSIGTTSWADGDQDLIDAAGARGLVTTTDMPAMVCDERLPEGSVPAGIELRPVTTDADVRAYVAMADAAYTSLGLPAGVISAMADAAHRAPVPHEVTVGAFEGDVLLSGAQLHRSHGIAGVYLVATAEAARGRGLADLVTRTVTNLGLDAGAPYVTLQASPMGEAIYRRMGYRELYRYATHTRFA